MENLFIEMQNKSFICPYFREEGEGQEGHQNVLIFMSLLCIRRRREGVKVNKDNVFICAIFLMASVIA